MVPFFTRFRDLALKEMRSATVRQMPDIPDGEYGFLELYCDEPDCDCRRVVIDVVSPATGSKIWATISYGWESVEYYERRIGDKETARECQGARLDPLNPQTKHSPALLQLFKWVLQDEAYVERLKRHYRLFKSDLRKKRTPGVRPARKAKRRQR
jgi:hypothetical protein